MENEFLQQIDKLKAAKSVTSVYTATNKPGKGQKRGDSRTYRPQENRDDSETRQADDAEGNQQVVNLEQQKSMGKTSKCRHGDKCSHIALVVSKPLNAQRKSPNCNRIAKRT